MDNLHIFFALNDSYTSHYCVTMVSVLTNTPNRHCHFYLLTDYISEKNKRRFSRVENNTPTAPFIINSLQKKYSILFTVI